MKVRLGFAATLLYILSLAGNMVAQAPKTEQLMDKKRQHIVEIAALTGKGDLDKLKTALIAGLEDGMTVNEIKETIVHVHAYCGFPRALRGLQTFVDVLNERKAKGIEDKAGRAASPITDSRSKYERGRDILAEISGVPADAPKADYAVLAPEIEVFLKEHLFADLFERDVLTYAEREIATVSVLAAIGNVEPMMKGHMNIALNVGVTPDELRNLLAIVEKLVGRSEADKTAVLETSSATAIFPKGNAIEGVNFNGTAYLQRLMTDSETFDVVVSDVIFEPSARNSWHSHPGGQILIATAGKGYYQEKGKPIQVLKPGDVIAIAPDVKHWHGAAPDSGFTHMAINTKVSLGATEWYDPVTDEEYNDYKE